MNLQRVAIFAKHKALSVKTFSDLFLEPKPNLQRIELHASNASSGSSVLEVLIDKRCLLQELSYTGRCPPLELLERVTISQTKLQKVFLTGKDACFCRDLIEKGQAEAFRATPRNMGMLWIPFLAVLLKNRSLTGINCLCKSSVERAPQTEVTEMTEACNVARSRKISVSVCDWRYI